LKISLIQSIVRTKWDEKCPKPIVYLSG